MRKNMNGILTIILLDVTKEFYNKIPYGRNLK
jgi:hypothetical protein